MTDAHLLIPGCRCEIRSLGDNGKAVQRLAQMGVLPGTQLEIVRSSPLGETLEVTSEEGEQFALRRDEMASLDCRVVATPLSSPIIQVGTTYAVLSLKGGRAFRQRMLEKDLQPGSLVHVEQHGPHHLTVSESTQGVIFQLGHGEAKKIIVRIRPEDAPA